jgi:uncharacterized protein
MSGPGRGYFPGRAPIDGYGGGGFRFAGMSHRGSILCLPSGIRAWAPAAPSDLDAEAFALLFAEPEPIDILLVGMGADPRPIPSRLKAIFRDRGIQSDGMATGAAVSTYNILLGENRRVAGAFLAVA